MTPGVEEDHVRLELLTLILGMKEVRGTHDIYFVMPCEHRMQTLSHDSYVTDH
jgi:hypothetical protein